MDDQWLVVLAFFAGAIMGLVGGNLIATDDIVKDCELVGQFHINGTVYQCSLAGEKE